MQQTGETAGGIIYKKKVGQVANFFMPKVGVEPTLLTEHEFESCASASSATPAGFFIARDSISKYARQVKDKKPLNFNGLTPYL